LVDLDNIRRDSIRRVPQLDLCLTTCQALDHIADNRSSTPQ
jgi:hypothetical protein